MNTLDFNAYCQPLIGQMLTSIEKRDHSWLFMFAAEISIVTESPWRLLTADRIVVASEDHGHQFGLSASVDAAERVLAGVSGKSVVAASIIRPAADLMVDFGGGAQLQFYQLSCGYEAWRLSIHGDETICVGGGNIAYIRRPVA